MTQATSIAARWHRSPRTYEVDHHDGEAPVWKVDGVYVKAEGDTLTVWATSQSARPEMRIEVMDGELRLPLEDLVPQVLERLSIAELAEMICADEDARRVILEALASRYNSVGIEDEDRRHWIAKAQAAVHDKSLDALTGTMASIERAVSQTGYRAMGDIAYGNVLRHELEDAGVDRETAKLRGDRYQPRQELVDFKPYVQAIGYGKGAWDAARDFWRSQLVALFPNVEVPLPLSPQDELEARLTVGGE